MNAKGSDALLKKLIEANIKTQESVSAVVSSVKELVTALREAGEVPEEELKIAEGGELKAISAKLDKLLTQNEQLAKMMAELMNLLKTPQGYRKL